MTALRLKICWLLAMLILIRVKPRMRVVMSITSLQKAMAKILWLILRIAILPLR